MTFGTGGHRMQTPEAVRQALIEQTRFALQVLEGGCQDHACEMVKPGPGMHTNGGCHCWAVLLDTFQVCHSITTQVRKPGVNRRCW